MCLHTKENVSFASHSIQSLVDRITYGDTDPVQCVLCCDPDLVPVCDQSHEAGIPGREQQAAPTSTLPEGKTGQEEHGAMRGFFSQAQLKTVSTSTALKCVYVYSVFTVSFSTSLMFTTVIVCYFIRRKKNEKKHAVTFNKALYF